jgi:predicted TIM-barrel fold metal-dependent hydrolase
MLDRLDHRFKHSSKNLAHVVSETAPREALPPMEYIRKGNLYFSAEIEDALLPQVLDLVGEAQIVFGSDMPHGDRERFAARSLLQRNDIGEATKAKILLENPASLYGLDEKIMKEISHAI